MLRTLRAGMARREEKNVLLAVCSANGNEGADLGLPPVTQVRGIDAKTVQRNEQYGTKIFRRR